METLQEIFIEDVLDILKRHLIKEEKFSEQIIRTRDEYFTLCSAIKNKNENFENIVGEICFASVNGEMKYKGLCNVCDEKVDFKLNTKNSNLLEGDIKKRPLWRESLWCPKCKLNNRMRYLIAKVRNQYTPGMNVYIYEQVTNGYKALKKYIPDLVGSEFLGEQYQSGDMVDGILHENAMNLSFPDDCFDMILSQDVFEHVPDYEKAFSEMARVLKPGKKAYVTVPIATLNTEIEHRACIENGVIRYLMEPMFHGNPLSKEGSLVFNIFSWDLFDCLKRCGFRDAYAVAYYSIENGNLGILPIFVEAVK